MKAKISNLLISRIIRPALKQREDNEELSRNSQTASHRLLITVDWKKKVLIKQRSSCDPFSDSH